MSWRTYFKQSSVEDKNEQQIKNELNEYLSFEIKSPTNLRKTREILMSIWVTTPRELLFIRRQALDAYETETCKLAAHWSMLLVTYPFFCDICSLIGKLASIQDVVNASWLKDRLYEIWGERPTLLYSVEKILQTLKYFGVIEPVKVGEYRIVTQEIRSQRAIQALLSSLLQLKESAYYDISELSCHPIITAFKNEVDATKERADYLNSLNILLQQAIKDLQADLNVGLVAI